MIFQLVISGILLLYLPGYSPDYNPIEECFGWMKAHIRKHHQDFRALVDSKSNIDVKLFLYDILSHVTPELAQGWFSHAGYM